MPKICCFSEQFEEIKKKLNKIKKFMGETFQNLRAQGKSVVVERQENIVIERSESNFIKRKQTITREKFRNDANLVTTTRRQDTTKHNNSKGGQQQKVIAPPIRLAKTTGKPNSRSKRSEVSFELAVLKQEIDDEIDKLKAIRRFTLQQTVNANNNHTYKKNNINNMGKQKQQKNSTIQNDRTWDQNFSEQNPTNIKYTFEKYSSEHRMRASASATTHNQYHRDEQTSCRPRMRTIGLQKNTHRTASASRKKDPAFQNSALNLKLNSIDSIPVTATTYCFDYVPECNIGDYYNNSNQQCSKNSCNNNCCQKYCQRVLCNSKNNNGVIYNQNTYSEKGKTPCTEYNYCCDEYFYKFPPCNQQQPSPPAMICCKPTGNAPRCCYHGGSGNNIRQRHSQHQNQKPIVGYHRRGSDLCTDEFYHKTLKCDERITKCEDHIVKSEERKRLSRSPLRRTKEKQMTKKFISAINERQRELEKAEVKAQERKKRVIRRDDKKILTTTSEEEHAAKMAELLLMGEKSKRQSKFTKKEICRLRKLLASTDDDGECDNVSAEVELDEDTKRMMEKMRIKEYKPTKPKTDNKELEVDKLFEEEIAKLTTSERQQDLKKEKQYEEYIDKYDKPVSDLNQELSTLEEQEKTETTDYKDPETNGSPVAGNVSLNKTYTRLTSEQEQRSESINPQQGTTQGLDGDESHRSFLIRRKFSYPEEVVHGKVLPRFEPKGSAANKSLSMAERISFSSGLSKDNNLKLAAPPDGNTFVGMPPTPIEGTDSTGKDTGHLIMPQIVLENDLKGRNSTDISTPNRTSQSRESKALDVQNTLPDTIFRDSNARYNNSYQRGNLEVDEKTIEQIVSHISPSGDFIDTSREPDETSSFVVDRSARVDYYDRDIRRMDVKQMVQPADVKSLSSSSYDYNPPQQQKCRRECDQQYQICQQKCATRQQADPSGSVWDKYKTQKTTRKTQRNEGLCEVPEFNGCPCMFDTYLSLIAYLDVGKEKNRDICYRRAKSQS